MNQLGLFAKFWEPGKVKSRLAVSVGADLACQIYEQFLFHVHDQLEECGDQRAVVFWPPERHATFRSAISDTWDLIVQSEGDLGQRMAAFFDLQFQALPENSKVVLVGSDCPQLTPKLIEGAFASLDTNQVVLGPSFDGGYYLIGMRGQSLPWLFSDMPWSTDQVWERTWSRLRQQNVSCAKLPQLIDVDDIEALEDLFQQVSDLSESDATLALQLQQIQHLLRLDDGGDR